MIAVLNHEGGLRRMSFNANGTRVITTSADKIPDLGRQDRREDRHL